LAWPPPPRERGEVDRVWCDLDPDPDPDPGTDADTDADAGADGCRR